MMLMIFLGEKGFIFSLEHNARESWNVHSMYRTTGPVQESEADGGVIDPCLPVSGECWTLAELKRLKLVQKTFHPMLLWEGISASMSLRFSASLSTTHEATGATC